MRSEALKGHLDFLLLAIVADGPAHGYAIIEQLKERSDAIFDLPEGTVYPALHRLERADFIASRWDRSSGRKRRVYRITAAGRRALGKRRTEWETFASAVVGVVGSK